MHLAKVGALDVACLDLDEDQQTAFNMIDNLRFLKNSKILAVNTKRIIPEEYLAMLLPS